MAPRALAPATTVPHEHAVEGSARSWIEWTPDLIEAADLAEHPLQKLDLDRGEMVTLTVERESS